MTIEEIKIRQMTNQHLLKPTDKITVLHGEIFKSCFMDDFYGNLAFVYDRVPFVLLKAGFNRSADHYDEHSRSWVKRTVSGYLCHDF